MQSEDSIRAALFADEIKLARLNQIYAIASGDAIADMVAEKREIEIRIRTMKEVLEDGE